MKRFWLASIALALGGMVTSHALAGPPQAAAPSRTAQVKRHHDLASALPPLPPRIVRGASAEHNAAEKVTPVAHTASAPEPPNSLPPPVPGGGVIVHPLERPAEAKPASPPALPPAVEVKDKKLPAMPAAYQPHTRPQSRWVLSKETPPAPAASGVPAVIVQNGPPCNPAPVEESVVWTGPTNVNRGPRFYASGEYLLWWIKDSNYPVLATTGPFRMSPAGDPSPFEGSGGILGQPGTTILFGGGDVDNEERSGARFTAGGWFDECCKVGFEVGGFFLGERSVFFQRQSSDRIIARPFFNLGTEREDVQTTALPGLTTGRLTIDTPSELCGVEANLQCMLCNNCWSRTRLLAGFRYLNLDEGLFIREDIALGPNISDVFGDDFAFLNNANAVVVDSFDTRNQFYGGQVGLASQLRYSGWTLDFFGKVALGSTRQTVDIQGGQIVDSPLAGRQTFRGGLLALSSNIGERSRDVFSVVPEAGVTVGRMIGNNLRVFAGYNFLFWSNVVRPGDQIDRNLNPFLIPNFPQDPRTIVNPNPGQRPVFTFQDTHFWAQGVSFGLELNF